MLPDAREPRFRAAVRARAVARFSLAARTSVLEDVLASLSGRAEPAELPA